jgi:glycosyltransferase involved in cell wall biosynthesis
MRIGIDYRPVTAAPYTGIARCVLALEQALRSRPGVEVLRFTPAPFGHPLRETARCPAWESPVNGLHRPHERLLFEARFLPAAIREAELDVYIATVNAGLPPWGVPRRTRCILILHDVFQITLPTRTRGARAWAYNTINRISISQSVAKAEAIWSPSHYTAAQAGLLFPRHAARMSVLPNMAWPAPDKVQAPPSSMPRRFWLAVGTMEPRKNIPWFVQQWFAARAQDPDIPELVLVGPPQNLPETLRAAPGLTFATGIDDDALRTLYRHTERLWQPSYAEGFGLPVVEALALGASIAVATGSALDEVAPPDAPRFDPRDAAALQTLMRQLAREGRRPQDAVQGPAWAARFAMPAYTERLWLLLDGLVDGTPPA